MCTRRHVATEKGIVEEAIHKLPIVARFDYLLPTHREKLRGKVLTLKEQNKMKDQMSVPELKLTVRWYKRLGDKPVPQTRQALITRFVNTDHRDDQQLPFPRHSTPSPAVVVVTAPTFVAIPTPASMTATADPPFRDEV